MSAPKPDADETAPLRPDGRGPAAVERYVLLDKLGEGGMGVVWTALDRALDRKVAIKLLHDEHLAGAQQERLAAEARAMARLSHPNVVAVHDVGIREGRTFIAMELVTGQPLSTWAATPRPWPEVVVMFRALADGLAAAHRAGIIHRDVKPANILVGDDGRPRLADFGVAHASTPAPTSGPPVTLTTRTGGLIGTPVYMAPECLLGDPADARADQFGFASALYETLHGKRPFAAGTIATLATAIHRGPPPPVRPVPAWLHAACARGLAADPEARFPSMAAFAEALHPPRRRAWIAAVAGVVVAAAVAVAIVAWPRDGGRAAARDAAPELLAIAPTPDATPPFDAAAPMDAAPAADAASSKGKSSRPRPRRAAPDAGTGEDYATLIAKARAAFEAGEIARARTIAEQAIRISQDGDALSMAANMSCRLGDAKRARAHRRKMTNRNQIAELDNRCRQFGIVFPDEPAPTPPP